MIYAIKSLITLLILIALLAFGYFVMGLSKKKSNIAANLLIFALVANLIVIIWLA